MYSKCGRGRAARVRKGDRRGGWEELGRCKKVDVDGLGFWVLRGQIELDRCWKTAAAANMRAPSGWSFSVPLSGVCLALPRSRPRSIWAAGNAARCRCDRAPRFGPRAVSPCRPARWYTAPEPQWTECTREAAKQKARATGAGVLFCCCFFPSLWQSCHSSPNG